MTADEAFRERLAAASLASQRRHSVVEGLDLTTIPFPSIPLYGHQHGLDTSALAHHVAVEVLGVRDPEELLALRTAALLHDLGRAAPWQSEDAAHGFRSAELAGKLLRASNDLHGRTTLVDRVCGLIGRHSLRGERPSDPLAMALWDADAYESARLAPGAPEGKKIWRERTADDRLCTAWARQAENKRAMLRTKGWL